MSIIKSLSNKEEEELYQDWIATDKPLKHYTWEYEISLGTVYNIISRKLKTSNKKKEG